MQEHRFTVFLRQLQNDLKGFIWCCALFILFRILFIGVFSNKLVQGLYTEDTIKALWLGLRLSLKTAGFAMLFSAVICTVPRLFCGTWKSDTLRYYWFAFLTFLFSILFFARIPYYKIFNSGYNLMLINGKHDDIRAILVTAVLEYGLLWRLPLALLTSLGLCFLLKKWLRTGTHRFTVHGTKETIAKSVLLLSGIVVFWVFVRYGGTVFSKNTINWENASRFRSHLLNEAVLDDGQALYRVYSIYRRMKKATEITFTAEELRIKIANAGGNPQADTVDGAFLRTVTEEKLKTQPRHIVLVLGESYAQWPFLPQFDKPGGYLVEKGRKLAASSQSMQTRYMLAHGTGTMPAVNGFLSGLPDTGIYINYEKESFQGPYAMGIGSVLKQLGYKTIFWYGGFGSWQEVEPFARAQCFDEFRDTSGFAGYKGGNTWGAPDKELFANVSNYITQHKGDKTFHLILTTSNHPPYSINLQSEGFDSAKVKAQLPETIAGDKTTLNELGHIWYADHTMGEFVETVERDVPESLFVITGDHAERFSFAKEMDLQSLSSIPCIFYGKGIDPAWMPKNQFGSALQVTPTIAALVGRKGDTYNSIVPDLMQKQDFVFNHQLWADRNGMYVQDLREEQEPDSRLSFKSRVDIEREQYSLERKKPLSEAERNHMVTLRQIAAWRILKGNWIK